jgi:hypothetical protein
MSQSFTADCNAHACSFAAHINTDVNINTHETVNTVILRPLPCRKMSDLLYIHPFCTPLSSSLEAEAKPNCAFGKAITGRWRQKEFLVFPPASVLASSSSLLPSSTNSRYTVNAFASASRKCSFVIGLNMQMETEPAPIMRLDFKREFSRFLSGDASNKQRLHLLDASLTKTFPNHLMQ